MFRIKPQNCFRIVKYKNIFGIPGNISGAGQSNVMFHTQSDGISPGIAARYGSPSGAGR